MREKVTALIEEDPDVTLIQSGQSRSIPNWEVVGVDTTSKLPFTEEVQADSEDEAKAQVEGTGKSRGPKVVAEVRRA